MKPLRSRLFFGIGLAAAAGFYACGSSSNGNSGGTPPPNEAGSDTTSSSSGAGSSSGSGSGSGGEASTDSPENGDGGTPACAELPGTVVYVEADDSQEPLLKLLARQLRDDAGVVLAFELTDSCSLTKALYAGTRIPNATPLLYVPSTKENPSWTPSDPEQTCIAASTSGTAPDLGISAVFDSSCPNVGTPGPNVGVIGGPVQTQAFVVPTAEFTNQTSITAAEAYYAFGDGEQSRDLRRRRRVE